MSDLVGIPEEIKSPLRKFKDLPSAERRLIQAVLQGLSRGTGIARRHGLGVEGTLETLIGLCDKGIIKIVPGENDHFQIFSYDLKNKMYVERAEIVLKLK